MKADSGTGGRADGHVYVGWFLADTDRRHLLERFPPLFGKVVADHVTLCREDDPHAAILSEQQGRIIGHAVDPAGVEALVVEIDGSTLRPDGGVYHLTWSLNVEAGRKASHSNLVIAERRWAAVSPAILVTLHVGAWHSSRYL
jgi:hypothetical protein